MFIAPQPPTHLTSQFANVAYVNARLDAKNSTDLDAISWYIDSTGMVHAQETFEAVRLQVECLTRMGWMIVGNYASPSTNECTKSFAFIIDGCWHYLVLQAPGV